MIGVEKTDAVEVTTVTRTLRLKGQVALVTGASRGIGKAIALALADEGAHVVINYRASQGLAEEVLAEVTRLGGSASCMMADVSLRDQVEKLHEAIIRDFTRLDIVVNNAGITRDRSFMKMEPQEWEEVLSVNLRGVFNCTKVCLPSMIARRYGRIVNISSIVGQTGSFGQANYATAKAGVIGLTKTLAKELAGKGITVNAVAPGYIETEMIRGIPEPVRERILAQIPMGRFGEPEEVAKAVRFLVTEGDYITGQVIGINGGLYV